MGKSRSMKDAVRGERKRRAHIERKLGVNVDPGPSKYGGPGTNSFGEVRGPDFRTLDKHRLRETDKGNRKSPSTSTPRRKKK